MLRSSFQGRSLPSPTTAQTWDAPTYTVYHLQHRVLPPFSTLLPTMQRTRHCFGCEVLLTLLHQHRALLPSSTLTLPPKWIHPHSTFNSGCSSPSSTTHHLQYKVLSRAHKGLSYWPGSSWAAEQGWEQGQGTGREPVGGLKLLSMDTLLMEPVETHQPTL